MKEYDTFIKSLETLMLEGIKRKKRALEASADHHLSMLKNKRGWIPHTNPKEVK